MAAKEVPTFEIVIENGKPYCNICNKEFKSKDLTQGNRRLHEQSKRHQSALKPSQSRVITEQHQLRHPIPTKAPVIKPPKQANIVIIFNFDDTLFPTTKFDEILARPYRINRRSHANSPMTEFESKMTRQERLEFENMSSKTYDLLSQYIKQYTYRNIHIVSASYQGWVQMALGHVSNIGYYSQIYALISSNNISIHQPSRDEYQSLTQSDNKNIESHPATLWKYKTFMRIVNNTRIEHHYHAHTIINTFVIIGHSLVEYKAAELLNERIGEIFGKKRNNIFIDRYPLKPNPTIYTLIREQDDLLHKCQTKYWQHNSLLRYKFF